MSKRIDLGWAPRGGFWCEPEDHPSFFWPYCAIDGCPNGICFSRGDDRFCWPHGSDGQSLGEIMSAVQGELA